MQGTRVEHERYGEGIVSREEITNYEIYFARGGKMDIRKDSDELTIIDEVDAQSGGGIDFSAMEKMLSAVLEKHNALNENVPIGERWQDGTLILRPGDTDLQSKEIPMETFFHKIVMLRDKLRVFEQNINAHEKLNDAEKVDLQQYISRCYGTLTTFNLLFREKDHYFSSK
ncbi:MAG: hypothetical protein R2813_08665 [Flavobacteriales bacterium]